MLRRLFLAGAAVGLAGCGFRPRGAPSFHFERLHLAGFAEGSPLRRELERHLTHLPLERLEQRAQAQVILEALSERHDKIAVASTSAGQVREWQLQLALEYRLVTPSDELLLPATQLRLTRDLTTTEAAALGKEREEADLRRAMQSEAVALLLRRLAAVRLR
ncbi:LPS-assembly lipoprotein [Inhella inkyongensis]|uniref:LPS-assembly lipoprotein LptE n=1 Tax=Inhella inkyongensis TaxID=392593 RepID=A0A840S0V5_9BURK|nr:LPS assembly lipoprotein LptE [Inhella inkyongensis]MBB5203028.1 LPS-assembly lipoprotein [Inhella inkyongensis]